jgi:hypothetical protein
MIHLAYLRSLFGFAFKNNPLLYVSLFLSVISVCLELAAMTALMPLASLASDQPSIPSGILVRSLDKLGLSTDGRSILLVFIALFAARVLTQFAGQGLTTYLGKRILLQLTTRAFSALIRNVPIKELESKSISRLLVMKRAARATWLFLLASSYRLLFLGGYIILQLFPIRKWLPQRFWFSFSSHSWPCSSHFGFLTA